MKEQKKLEYQMFTLFIIMFIFFGVIVVTIKLGGIMTPKIDKKLNQYIKENYKDIENELIIGKTTYKQEKTLYQLKVSNENNKNLYFYVTYKNKDISSTYKKDYIEGNTLFTELKKQYEKEIKNIEDYKNTTITFPKKLNKYTKTNQEKIIKQETKTLPIYEITTELEVKNLNPKTIITKIKTYKSDLDKLNYNPKEYNFVISNQENIDEVIKIEKLTKDLIENNLDQIISGIINNDKNIIKKYNINYEYIN